MIISRIEKSRERKSEYLVYVDGEFCFNVPEHSLFRLELFEGKEVDKKELAWLKYQAQLSFAKSAAVKFLTRRKRTAFEVRNKLEAEYDAKVIDEVVSFLIQNGYIDDELYAEKYIAERKKLGNSSGRAILGHLKQKGISGDMAEAKLRELGYDEEENAKILVQKKTKSLNNYDKDKIKRYLYGRGFSMETINKVVKKNEET